MLLLGSLHGIVRSNLNESRGDVCCARTPSVSLWSLLSPQTLSLSLSPSTSSLSPPAPFNIQQIPDPLPFDVPPPLPHPPLIPSRVFLSVSPVLQLFPLSHSLSVRSALFLFHELDSVPSAAELFNNLVFYLASFSNSLLHLVGNFFVRPFSTLSFLSDCILTSFECYNLFLDASSLIFFLLFFRLNDVERFGKINNARCVINVRIFIFPKLIQ